MASFEWDEEKNAYLQETREVSFEEIVLAISEDGLLDDIEHPNPKRYAHQRVLVVQLGSIVFAVPYIESEERIFLKTIYPSRKLSKKYLGGSFE